MVRKMKDSEIEWIGKIPENWEVRKIKNILKERNEKNNPIKSDNILSLTMEQGVILYKNKKGGGNKAKEDLSAYKLAYPNDIVLNSMNVIAGSVGLSSYFGCVSPVYYMLYSDDSEISISYYNNLFQSKVFQLSLMGLGNGIMMKESSSGKLNTIRMRISIDKLKNIFLPVPSQAEQQKIANFLDEKIAHIDSIIENTKQSIGEFKKYKQALITETVTKGLNRDVEMKDSKVEWMNEIPEHWNITKLKNYVTIRNGKDNTIKEGDIPVYGSGGQFSYTDEFIYDKPSVLLGRKGTIDNPMYVDHPFWSVDTSFYTIPKNTNDIKFFYYCAKSIDYKKYVYGTALPSMTQTILNNIVLPLPSVKEQQQIVDYLDEKTTHIDNLIENKVKMITQLEEYKKSMIYEYVTGKKEVE